MNTERWQGTGQAKKDMGGGRASQGRSTMDVGAKEAEQTPSACCYESGQGSISHAWLGLGPGRLVLAAQQAGMPSHTLLASVTHGLLHAQTGPP